MSINTTDGKTEEFTCIANNNPTIFGFLINGTAATLDSISKRGFTELTTESLGNGEQRARLQVIASAANNSNSPISCQAVGSGMIVNSNIATLLVQGIINIMTTAKTFC